MHNECEVCVVLCVVSVSPKVCATSGHRLLCMYNSDGQLRVGVGVYIHCYSSPTSTVLNIMLSPPSGKRQ